MASGEYFEEERLSFEEEKKLRQTYSKNNQELKVEEPKTTCFGITNKCKDGSYVLFIDFDEINVETLNKNLASLQERFKYKLTNFLVLSSSPIRLINDVPVGSFHAISFRKLSFHECLEVLSFAVCDPMFYKALGSTTWRANTLRISPKFKYNSDEMVKEAPKFYAWFPVKPVQYLGEVSSPHLNFYLKKMVGEVSVPFVVQGDGAKTCEFDRYNSKKE
jgi:hypothetical protein